MVESRRRSVLKVMSWRVTATLTTTVISYFVTGNVNAALTIGMAEMIFKLIIHYYHERMWNRIKFGVKPLDYQI